MVPLHFPLTPCGENVSFTLNSWTLYSYSQYVLFSSENENNSIGVILMVGNKNRNIL